MKNKKFSRHNKDKKVNTIIEIRKEILTTLRDLSEDLDRELFNSKERTKIRRDVREVAEMIRDKDRYMNKVNELDVIPKNELVPHDKLLRDTRRKIKVMLKYKLGAIVSNQYDVEELEIVEQEIYDAMRLIDEKDRLVIRRRCCVNTEDNEMWVNPHLKKHFKMDDGPDM